MAFKGPCSYGPCPGCLALIESPYSAAANLISVSMHSSGQGRPVSRAACFWNLALPLTDAQLTFLAIQLPPICLASQTKSMSWLPRRGLPDVTEGGSAFRGCAAITCLRFQSGQPAAGWMRSMSLKNLQLLPLRTGLSAVLGAGPALHGCIVIASFRSSCSMHWVILQNLDAQTLRAVLLLT